jgi:hypothetical protein
MIVVRMIRGAGILFALLFVLPLFFTACPQQTDPRAEDPFELEGSDALVGTVWEWDGLWGYRTLTFETADAAVYRDGSYDPPEETRVRYVFDTKTGMGLMDVYGPFSKNGNKRLEFSDWKKYGHGAEYVLLEAGP